MKKTGARIVVVVLILVGCSKVNPPVPSPTAFPASPAPTSSSTLPLEVRFEHPYSDAMLDEAYLEYMAQDPVKAMRLLIKSVGTSDRPERRIQLIVWSARPDLIDENSASAEKLKQALMALSSHSDHNKFVMNEFSRNPGISDWLVSKIKTGKMRPEIPALFASSVAYPVRRILLECYILGEPRSVQYWNQVLFSKENADSFEMLRGYPSEDLSRFTQAAIKQDALSQGDLERWRQDFINETTRLFPGDKNANLIKALAPETFETYLSMSESITWRKLSSVYGYRDRLSVRPQVIEAVKNILNRYETLLTKKASDLIQSRLDSAQRSYIPRIEPVLEALKDALDKNEDTAQAEQKADALRSLHMLEQSLKDLLSYERP